MLKSGVESVITNAMSLRRLNKDLEEKDSSIALNLAGRKAQLGIAAANYGTSAEKLAHARLIDKQRDLAQVEKRIKEKELNLGRLGSYAPEGLYGYLKDFGSGWDSMWREFGRGAYRLFNN